MKKRNILMLIPLMLLPYVALFTVLTVIMSTQQDFFRFIMESVFASNALYLILAFLLYCIVATMLTVLCIAFSFFKGWEPLPLVRTVMVIKLVQIPAYVMIFVLGVLFAITLFTIPFAIGFFLLDCILVALSGALVISAVINSVRKDIFKFKDIFWIIPLQFVFCADVVTTIIFYVKLKRANKNLV